MFAPVGPQPPSVYWRRRLVLLVFVLVLALLIGRALLSGDSGASTAASATSGSATSGPATSGSAASAASSSSAASPALSVSSIAPSTSAAAPTRAQRTGPVGSVSSGPSPSTSHSSPPPPKPCAVSALGLAAQTGQTEYSATDQPVLSILVTNPDAAPCVQDLADAQIALRVYNGVSRVWGSHDCKPQPGTDEHILTGRSSVRVSVVWSGLSSQPNCSGIRQRVGAGTYTLYASLAGREAKAAQFSIT